MILISIVSKGNSVYELFNIYSNDIKKMAKIRLYIPPQEIKESIALDKRGPLHKLKNVLRLKKGQKIYIFDGNGKEWEYKIEKAKKKHIIINKIKKDRESARIKPKLTLGFPLIQEKKIDFILQKATELGVSEFIPYYSSRSRGGSRAAPTISKIERWQKIIVEASRQSERLWLPRINQPLALDQLIKKNTDLKIVGAPREAPLHEPPLPLLINTYKTKNILCIVGPEGGFCKKEIDNFQKHNCRPINLSLNVLRTETAAIFLSGLIKYLTDK
ncbi:MAG: 16S rRNA (uracil(1498)-N(3))-methyltransferase [Candidatus Omnitrophica bacterium]|nr:16S rRNA (uracil(1498)-N(3))-methyltransferase [Candidatus Omnitrophota bacterium]MCF7887710.1 16S rRNA (uracil(1498)-N(3))-methyltransferase [Candidatus Omnitrophota bacterium]